MSSIAKGIERACVNAYEVAALTLDALRHTGEALRRHKLLFKHLYLVGNSSLGIVSLFGFFVGMILVLYAGDTLERFGQQKYVGLTGLAIVWEFGPVFTAFILAGRIGSSYTAEIGTMKVYDEVDALQALGIRPTAYLVTPRLLACLLMLPALACFADLWALLGGATMGWVFAHVAPAQFFHVLFQNLKFYQMGRSILKAFVFGGIIAITGCYHGLQTSGGAEGVGRRTTRSVVHSLLSVLIADYLISKILLTV